MPRPPSPRTTWAACLALVALIFLSSCVSTSSSSEARGSARHPINPVVSAMAQALADEGLLEKHPRWKRDEEREPTDYYARLHRADRTAADRIRELVSDELVLVGRIGGWQLRDGSQGYENTDASHTPKPVDFAAEWGLEHTMLTLIEHGAYVASGRRSPNKIQPITSALRGKAVSTTYHFAGQRWWPGTLDEEQFLYYQGQQLIYLRALWNGTAKLVAAKREDTAQVAADLESQLAAIRKFVDSSREALPRVWRHEVGNCMVMLAASGFDVPNGTIYELVKRADLATAEILMESGVNPNSRPVSTYGKRATSETRNAFNLVIGLVEERDDAGAKYSFLGPLGFYAQHPEVTQHTENVLSSFGGEPLTRAQAVAIGKRNRQTRARVDQEIEDRKRERAAKRIIAQRKAKARAKRQQRVDSWNRFSAHVRHLRATVPGFAEAQDERGRSGGSGSSPSSSSRSGEGLTLSPMDYSATLTTSDGTEVWASSLTSKKEAMARAGQRLQEYEDWKTGHDALVSRQLADRASQEASDAAWKERQRLEAIEMRGKKSIPK
jgi:hypothetical protein